MRRLASLSFAFVVAACGSDGASDNPGTGTGTLTVQAQIRSVAELPNRTNTDEFYSGFEVVVLRGQEPVTDATVTITSSRGAVTLDPQAYGTGYDGWQEGYARVYTVDVVAGEDSVTGVTIVGPDLHVFTSPGDEPVPADQDLTLEWTRDEAAEEASLSTNLMEDHAVDDTGASVIPAEFLADGVDSYGDRPVLRRENRLIPGGAADGSF